MMNLILTYVEIVLEEENDVANTEKMYLLQEINVKS